MTRLAGKVAAITGGASGIGRATVEAFVGEETDVEALVAHAVKTFGRLDCIFNNAGFAGVTGSIADIAADEFDTTMRVLLRGVFLGMKHAARVMKPQGSGSIISTASVAGLDSSFGPHVYDAAKAAVIHLTRSVAKELGGANVRVNCICPGYIATPIFGKSHGFATQVADQTIQPVKQFLSGVQPIARAGLPEDIANAALWLASDESTFVSGHALVVDGALLAGRRWEERQRFRDDLRAALGVAE